MRKLPFIIAVLGMVGGVFIGVFFGANEDYFQDRISAGLARNPEMRPFLDGGDIFYRRENSEDYIFFVFYDTTF